MKHWLLLWIPAAALAAGCGDDEVTGGQGGDGGSLERFYPDNFLTAYTEVDPCRRSGDHDLSFVRVFVDDEGLASFNERTTPFPAGSVVVKVEYADPTCSDLISTTAMRRRADSTDLGWEWQRVEPDGAASAREKPRCVSCHRGCGAPPTGFDGVCTELVAE